MSAAMRAQAALCAALLLCLALTVAGSARGQAVPVQAVPVQAVPVQPAGPAPGGDPFGQSQLATLAPAAAGPAGVQFTVRGFVDAGYLHITQEGPAGTGGERSWAYGNSQFTFWSQTSSFVLNEVDLTLEGRRETATRVYGARASVDFYPSRDDDAYGATGGLALAVDEGFVFVEWSGGMRTRLVLGKAPGFVTLEQLEGDVPEQRLVGHTYVYLAGGGYPTGLQALLWPTAGLALKLGLANGGLAAYSFDHDDDSTLNRGVARDADDLGGVTDKVDSRTVYGAVDWVPFDRPAGAGTLRLGVAFGSAPELTWDAGASEAKPYSFRNGYAGYRLGALELRLEAARYAAFFEGATSLGQFDAAPAYLLLSWHLGADHLLTGRYERMTFESSTRPDGTATKLGATWRWRLDDGVALRVEAVRETQSPQFWVTAGSADLTTTVLATSLVYSF
jgi:hypothetical protein